MLLVVPKNSNPSNTTKGPGDDDWSDRERIHQRMAHEQDKANGDTSPPPKRRKLTHDKQLEAALECMAKLESIKVKRARSKIRVGSSSKMKYRQELQDGLTIAC